MKTGLILAVLVCLVSVATAKVYFSDTFDGGDLSKWVKSTAKGADAGDIQAVKAKYFADEDRAYGMKTMEDAKFYQISAALDEEFDNENKDLVLQFIVKHEQNIDCGGGYVKLLPPGLNQKKFDGDSEYHFMFGPDICGPSNRKVHAIITHDGKNHLITKEISISPDEYSHVYTLIIHPDQTFEVLVDGEEKRSGNIVDEWDILAPKQIKDPEESKPEDWVDEKEIDDPEDVKPEGWDDIPETIVDPEAERPDDWDEELDGEWEPPVIDNPEYKGEWVARKIPNPAYKGPWIHPMIDNPDYKEDNEIYHKVSGYIGIEIWQVKAGTVFDDFLVTDDVELAAEWRKHAIESRDAEKEAKEAEEAAAREAAAAARAAEEDEEEEDDADWEEDDAEDHVHDEL